MNKIITLLIIMCSIQTSQSQNKVKFSYDTAGNQINREICFGSCLTAKPAKDIKEEALTEDDLQKFSQTDSFSYYPNPVREELYLRWELTSENAINSVEVYSILGTVVKSYHGVSSANSLNIPFREYSNGVYLISINYANGDQKTIKIIKQ
ncbi:hypothetical protein FLA105534_04285 [Flavobacterium bizetiae]|uniref:Secretion system C-terminal sorting domain-containing protein n=1 Tax=Flavobacterium bizetiae TaxID=2704140 RepID=A0A6J4GVC7_9FLAO|nr:T9SS type A sorting domain-containing protein [Flavobacterium bizetiae]CAA9202859.1 hypothetical protein FLA105534_04285 [Flavobacterium bizetiae]CAD5343574.1 hypothetical protein FLA105535_03574 [Flavobacterium bizetiae]CAD5349569.1 hypothetical protein FLA105534_03555 [Flavobacterium bizetiae]